MSDASISRDAVRAVFHSTHSLPDTHTHVDQLMGGHGTITVVGVSPALLVQLWDFARALEALWSRFLPESDLSRLNWAEGGSVKVDPLTVQLIDAMREGYAVTSGSYDPTLLPDVIAAGYQSSQVDPARVTMLPASAHSPGNLAGVRVDGTSVTMPLGTTLDAGGIGKGFAADLVVQRALDEGAWGAMAEFGGDIAVAGQAPDGQGWHLGLENPYRPDEHLDVVSLSRGGIVTSSQLKRRFGSGETATHHLVDPSTRRSAHTSVRTVTVIAGTAARAEVLTKRGFVEDPEQYLTWLPRVGAAGLLVLADHSTLESTNWGDYR